METPNYPIGTQSFVDIRRNGYVYIDKTQYIPLLRTNGKYKFLSRPRRFGKSLLISTLEAYFSNRRELFKGLAIDTLQPGPWEEYTVLHFDFSGDNYNSAEVLRQNLSVALKSYESELDLDGSDKSISLRFKLIVAELYKRTGRGVVILIDEYDNPITSAIGKPELQENLRQILYGFYSSFKSLDHYIHFCMLTGVTKYGKMSVFSGLNNLSDISFDNEFAAVCGITEKELHDNLHEGVEKLALKLKVDTNKAYNQLKTNYDGYHFSEELLDVYNPFSIINALAKSSIRKYWFGTATPSLLLNVLERLDFDVESLNGAQASIDRLGNISAIEIKPIPLFYQTGYLTIKSYDEESELFTLGFPNREVESAFMDNILSNYTDRDESEVFVSKMRSDLKKGNVDGFIECLKTFLAGIPYDLRKNVAGYENYYHTIFYSIFYLIGVEVAAEYHTSEGSIDLVMRTQDYIYIIELKINGTAQEAIAQIHRKHYAAPFADDPRKKILIGLGFSRITNTIESSEVE